ncbi:DUF3800 domain-containing protein [Rhodospirillaceae bacterium SYSU D60014]|uniref:DUF3800 domain-containing protein n=1 Tax=Virgifigura deserti TaxID=2268457 RepID=UPI000E661CEB
MPIRTLYFDESGFTGYNLLDGAQPIFTVASTDIDTVVAETILKESFPKYRGSEFKFANIWGSNNKAGLVEFSRRLGGLRDHAFTWMIDKRFAVLTKIVDFLIEPYITDAGYDFYADGFCWKYANYIHFGLMQFAAPELYDSLVKAYQTFSRNPSPERLSGLQNQLGIMAASSEEPIRIFLEQMSLGADLFAHYHNLETFKKTNELQVTSILAVIAHWRKLYSEDFAVIHDASANFFRQREIWDRITNNNVPAQMMPLGDGALVQYPLRVVSTTQVNSEDNYSVQLCDVLAGVIARHFDMRIDGDNRKLLDEVINAGLNAIEYNGIRPSQVFPDRIPPKRLAGPDVVDRMTGIIFGPHNNPR